MNLRHTKNGAIFGPPCMRYNLLLHSMDTG